jgi:SAM-dependent methyltransferase
MPVCGLPRCSGVSSQEAPAGACSVTRLAYPGAAAAKPRLRGENTWIDVPRRVYGRVVIYQHPLAYLLGMEGLALLHAWGGEYDREFTQRRLAEVRALLADRALADHEGVLVERSTTLAGYRQWAATYDGEPRNSLFDQDEPVLHRMIGALPAGDALDAACGTGRLAEYLAAQGFQVLGVDSSAEMLEKARARVPAAEFRLGDLRELPVTDDSVDLVVSGLALSHTPSLEPVLAEFARVLRPGGHAVISDCHHEIILRGSRPHALGPAGEPGLVPSYQHTAGDFVRAALAAGLRIRACEEPGRPTHQVALPPSTAAPTEFTVGDWADWPWSLIALLPEAARVAWAIPAVIVWHFELPSDA